MTGWLRAQEQRYLGLDLLLVSYLCVTLFYHTLGCLIKWFCDSK